MPVLAFDMSAENSASRRFEFRGLNNADYYDGDFKPMSPADIDMKIEKSVAGAYNIYNLNANSPLSFRRSWQDIRKDKTNVTVFWFVRRGHITISYPGVRHDVGTDQCALTRSCKPFYMEVIPDDRRRAEVMHVVVPSHKIYALVSDRFEAGKPFPAAEREVLLAARIFDLLFEEGEQVDPDIASQLVEVLLKGLGRSITRMFGEQPPRSSISEQRMADILRYIEQNFANPDLNAKMVADGCRVSLRYLCHLMKKQELSFSARVWNMRMQAAHDWLSNDRMKHYSIGELAYLAGFKSSAHFSRMFKKHYLIAPREFRHQQARGAGLAA